MITMVQAMLLILDIVMKKVNQFNFNHIIMIVMDFMTMEITKNNIAIIYLNEFDL
jgi:hypothetical protein